MGNGTVVKSLAIYTCAMRALVVWGIWAPVCSAALIVNPPRPITHQVEVQIIETALSNGTSPATIFGTASERAAIEAEIDRVWAQAGIDISFLPTTLRYNNTFAYQGNGGSRPSGDLGTIISQATAAGKVNVDPSVINMFFVNVVPGFGFTSENTANGIANIGHDGIAQFVGDALLTWGGGHDVIASVVSHEIGHNLGLSHSGSGQPNLMSSGGSSAQLSPEQIALVFSRGTGFPQPISTALLGDFNSDGAVNHLDIDRLAWAAHNEPGNLVYDLNGDNVVTYAVNPRNAPSPSDSDVLIRDILDTEYGDLDLNGEVFLADLNTFAANYRQVGQLGWANGNINGSQESGTASSPRVFLADLNALASYWRYGVAGSGSGAGFAIPEPSSVLLALWAAAFCRTMHGSRSRRSGCHLHGGMRRRRCGGNC
jgi:hypothetical protein